MVFMLAACGESGEGARKPKGPPVAAQPPAPAPERRPPAAKSVVWQSKLPQITLAEVDSTLRLADQALARGQFERGASPGPGALELYLAVLQLAPEDARAQAGVQAALDALLERGRLAMRAGRIEEAARVQAMAPSRLAYRRGFRRALVASRLCYESE